LVSRAMNIVYCYLSSLLGMLSSLHLKVDAHIDEKKSM
jgi:hypothetical protein